MGRDHELTVARLADLERDFLLEICEVRGGDDVKARKIDRGDLHRLAFDDRQRDVDGVLLVVQLDVESGDARIRKAAVGVERLNALQVGIEPRAIEIVFPAPRQLRAFARRERRLEPRIIDCLDALELETVNLDRAFFFTRSKHERQREHEEGRKTSSHNSPAEP